MSAALLAIVSVLLVSVIPLVGIAFFFVSEKLMRRCILFLVSFSTGAMLGDVFLHMIPEMREGASFVQDMYLVLFGILASFAIEKTIHWRHCHVLPGDPDEHDHVHPMGTLSLIGDIIHNVLDGIVIAGSYLVSFPVGVSTTLAVMFHEIPQEIGDYAILLHSGYTRRRAILLNLYAQASAVAGAALFLVASGTFSQLTVYLLPFAAGNFVYIAGSDLIPELHKETGFRRALLQLGFMMLGILVMCALTMLE